MIDISFSFKSLFKLSVLHNYYAEQPSDDFKLLPTADTLKFAKRLGLILKETNSEAYLLYEPDKLEGLHSELNKNISVKISYLLYTSNPYFFNFTEMPVDMNTDIYYFSNNKVRHSGSDVFLHETEFSGGPNRFPLKKSVEISAEGSEKLLELKNDIGQTIYKKILKAGEKVIVTNGLVPIGLYQLFEDGNHKDTFILYTDVPLRKPLALIDISLTGIVKEELIAGIEENDLPNFNYKISFSTRHTFWKYFLVSKYNSNLKNTIIDSGLKHLKFQGPQEVKLQNGKDAVMFISEEPLPLKQINDYRFQLKSLRSGLSGGKILMDKLPLASADLIRPETKEENSKIFSEIIIYL